MAYNLLNPVFSFIEFGPADNIPEKITLPVAKNTDISFQVHIQTDSEAETDAMMLKTHKLYLVNHNANIIDGATLATNTLINYSNPAGANKVAKVYKTDEDRFTIYWPFGLFTFKTVINQNQCFSLCLVVIDQANVAKYYISNSFSRQDDIKYTALLDYSCDENAFDFIYCTPDNYSNRVRLPINIRRPQLPDERTTYARSNGSIKTNKAISKKEYECVTELFTEEVHEALKHALMHDEIIIECRKYTGGGNLSGNYDIKWPEFNIADEVAPAEFKLAVTPYNWRNNNCADCNPITSPGVGGCSLAISTLNIVDGSGPDGSGNWTYDATWLNAGGTPLFVALKYSIDGGVTWLNIPSGSQVSDTKWTYALGLVNPIDHMVQAEPFCDVSTSGTLATDTYTSAVACHTPEGLLVTSINSNDASVQWTKVTPTPPSPYQWELYLGGLMVQSGTTSNPGTTQLLFLAGLSNLSTYRIRVRTNCGAGSFSAWTQKFFTTPV